MDFSCLDLLQPRKKTEPDTSMRQAWASSAQIFLKCHPQANHKQVNILFALAAECFYFYIYFEDATLGDSGFKHKSQFQVF